MFKRSRILALVAAGALAVPTVATAQYGYDDGYYDGDSYYDSYGYDNDTDEYEYEAGEGVHEEEWYDPSDWFNDDGRVANETDYDDYDYDLDADSEYEYAETSDTPTYYYYDRDARRADRNVDVNYDLNRNDGDYRNVIRSQNRLEESRDGDWRRDRRQAQRNTRENQDRTTQRDQRRQDDRRTMQRDRDGDTYAMPRNQRDDRGASSQDRQQQDRQQQDRQRQDRQQQSNTVQGEVQNVQTFQHGQHQHRMATLRTDDGKRVQVDLGPTAETSDLTLRQGMQLRVMGQRDNVAGRELFKAQRLTTGDDTRIRIDRPREQQNRQGITGEITRLIERRDPQGQPTTLAVIETQKGNRVIADLGRSSDLRDLNMQEGWRVNARGRLLEANGQKVLIVGEIRRANQSQQSDNRQNRSQSNRREN